MAKISKFGVVWGRHLMYGMQIVLYKLQLK